MYICLYCGIFSFGVFSNLYKVIKVGMNDMQKWVEEVLESHKALFLCFFFMYVYILWQGQKAVLTIVVYELVDILYSKFQWYQHFPFAVNFAANCFLLCGLSCKWVTCRSGCKRFWKQALHSPFAHIPGCTLWQPIHTSTQ